MPGRHVGNKLAGIVGSTMLVGPILTGIMAQAQPPQVAESPPSFEVASIKANHSGERILNPEPEDEDATNDIRFALMIREMVRRLLEDRFQIKYHWTFR